MSGITVGRRGDELIAVKRADPDDPHRRRNEAELLARLDHPGIVRLVAFVDGEQAELQTAYIGTDTWARTPPSTGDHIVDGLSRVASTVADLHESGTSHGALVAEHIVVDRDRLPILCGLADARPLDPATERDDLVALAGIVRDLSAAAPDDLRRELDDLARQATSDELTARDLAAALASLAGQTPTRSASRRRPHLPPRVVLVACLTVLVIGGLALLLGSPGDASDEQTLSVSTPPGSAPPTTTEREASATTSTASAPPTTPTTTTTPTPSTTPPTTTGPELGVEFVHDGRRYGLGAPGDIAVLGDWDCDGIATPALLRIADRTVAVFDRWPEPGSALAAVATSVEPAAIDLEAVEDDGCHRLRVLEPDGSHLFTPEA
ncbi:MAG: hypothetical protein R2707_02710 [Acidimicrobiales bacterium]